MKKIILIVVFFIFLSLINNVNAETRDLTSITECNGRNCVLHSYLEPVNYFENNTWKPINHTIVNSTNPDYDYMIETGLYHVYFKGNPAEENPIMFMHELYLNRSLNLTLWLQPYALIWRNKFNDIQLINYVQNITGYPIPHIWDTEHHWFNDTDTILYPNIFGYGTNLTFEYTNTQLNKKLYVVPENLPYPLISLQGLTLDLVFKVDVPDYIKIWIKNNLWNGSNIDTEDPIFLKVKDKALAYLKSPYAKEKFHWVGNNATQEKTRLKYDFRIISGDLYIAVRTPAQFLNNTNLMRPIEIDPTITLTLSNSEDDCADTFTGSYVFDNDNSTYRIATSSANPDTVAIRFLDMTLAQGTDLISCNLTIPTWASCAVSGCNTSIHAHNVSNSPVWSSSNRPKDAQKTGNWTKLSVSGQDISNGWYALRIINVTTSTQEILDRTDWTSGNNLSYILKNNGTVFGSTLTFDTIDSYAPASELKCSYTTGVSVNSCMNLTALNAYYILTTNLVTNGTCFFISNDNITLDCSGYKITGNKTNTSAQGIYSSGKFGALIQNCNITNFYIGIALNNSANNGTMRNNTLYSDGKAGILINNKSLYANITNNSFIYTWASSVDPATGSASQFCNLSNEKMEGDIIICSSNNSMIMSNYLRGNGSSGLSNHDGVEVSIALVGSNNSKAYYNVMNSGDNYGFHVVDTTNCEIFYNSENGTGNETSANTNDGIILGSGSNNCNISHNSFHKNWEWGIFESGGNAYHYIYNNTITNQMTSAGVGIRVSSSYNTIKNNNISNNFVGIRVETVYNNISNNNITGSGTLGDDGILLYRYSGAVQNNRFENNTIAISGLGSDGITCGSRTDTNTFINNNITLNSGLAGVYFVLSNNNNFTNNRITTYGGHGIYFATSTGNYFFNSSVNVTSSGYDLYVENTGTNTLLNTTFDKYNTYFLAGSTAKVYVKWYMQVNVTNTTGNPLIATVNVTDDYSNSDFYGNTGLNGLTTIFQVFEGHINATAPKVWNYTTTIQVNKTGYPDYTNSFVIETNYVPFNVILGFLKAKFKEILNTKNILGGITIIRVLGIL
jgi:parallel beta-helix repeat protein